MNKVRTKLVLISSLIAIMTIGMIAATIPSLVFVQGIGSSSTGGNGGSSNAQSGSTNGGNAGHGGNGSSFGSIGSHFIGKFSGRGNTHGVGCSPWDPRC